MHRTRAKNSIRPKEERLAYLKAKRTIRARIAAIEAERERQRDSITFCQDRDRW